MYNELFSDTSLEVGKTLSKGERDEKNLNHEKVRCVDSRPELLMRKLQITPNKLFLLQNDDNKKENESTANSLY